MNARPATTANAVSTERVLAKGEGAPHWIGVAGDIIFEVCLGQGLVAADDLGRVVKDQFAVGVLQAVLDAYRVPLIQNQKPIVPASQDFQRLGLEFIDMSE